MATRAANEMVLHLVKLGLYASFGLLSGKALLVGGMIAGAAILSSWAMKWVLPRLSENFFRRVGYAAMVVSGLSLFTEAAGQVVTQTPIAIDYAPLSNGLETQLQWRKALFSLEFEYDEGFEFEHSISLADLPADKQMQVKQLSKGADKVFLEEVFGMDKHTYEVYLYRKGNLTKIDI